MRDNLIRLTQHRSLRWTTASMAVIALVLVGWSATDREQAPTAAPATAGTTTSGPGSGSGSGTTVRTPRLGEPDVTWTEFAHVDLPVSRKAGPYVLTPTRAFGFSQDDAGAALAAAHILVRCFAGAGSDSFVPTIREQVRGASKEQLAARTQSSYDGSVRSMRTVKVGEPLQLSQGWVVAYRMISGADERSADKRTVQILVEGSGESLGFTEYTVDLLWVDGDWRAEAPRMGDWGTVARLVNFPYPTSYRSYDDITSGTGENS